MRVWAVDRLDGRVLKTVALKASGDTCKKELWPAALVKAIRDDNSLVRGSKVLHAGVIKGTSFDVGNASHCSAEFTSVHADCNRLWVFSTFARLYTNAPFVANQVIANNLAGVDFTSAQRLCVQVRDSVSQGLLESIMVSSAADSDAPARAKALCETVGKSSQVLRAGVLASDGISIAPGSQGNALWMPQLSDLSVTVEPAPWVTHGPFKASRALTAEDELRIYVHDDVTGAPLPGSPLIFKPKAEELALGTWPAALHAKLKVSVLADYLSLELDAGEGATQGIWKRAGVALRLLMSEPLEDNAEWVPMMPKAGMPDQSISVKEQLSMFEAIKAKNPPAISPYGKSIEEANAAEQYKHFEVELRDQRTGFACYRWSFEFDGGGDAAVSGFISELKSRMKMSGSFEPITGTIQSFRTEGKSNEATAALWLPAKLGLVACMHWRPLNTYYTLLTKVYNEPVKLTLKHAQYGAINIFESIENLESLDCVDEILEIAKLARMRRYYDIPQFEHFKGIDFSGFKASKLSSDEVRVPDHQVEQLRKFIRMQGWASGVRQSLSRDQDVADIMRNEEVWAESDSLWRLAEIIGFDQPNVLGRHDQDEPDLPSLVNGDSVTFLGGSLQLRLESEMAGAGIRFVSRGFTDGLIDLYFPVSNEVVEPSVVAAHFTALGPWCRPYRVELNKPVDTVATFKPDDTLCADRCMTLGAHVYDTGGARENGVDENTGLFHAHYPVATLRGLGGKGPELDLTLHYSAVRANEGALGDGWALRFSYFDNRRRILTLSSGQTLTLTKAQMKTLSADKAHFLDQDGYRITGVEGDENALTALTVQMPAGGGGREEVIKLPATHDKQEAGDAFKKSYKAKLESIIGDLTRWIDKEKISTEQIATLKKQRDVWKAELADIERNGLVLVTSSIRSPQGAELSLAWEGTNGHIRLLDVTDVTTKTKLLTATHGTPVTQGSWQSTFTVWPGTSESYQVVLDIQNCLLKSLKRHRLDAVDTPERCVRFGYDPDDALDRVLTSIAEEDGSVEVVKYSSVDSNAAPRVQMHTLIPGAGQRCISHSYEWEGAYMVTQVRKRHHDTAVPSAEPFVQTSWTFQNGMRLVDAVVEEQPGVSRRTTRFTYPATAPKGDFKQLLLSRPTKTEVTTEALDRARAEEKQS